jgi:hypothetical protein
MDQPSLSAEKLNANPFLSGFFHQRGGRVVRLIAVTALTFLTICVPLAAQLEGPSPAQTAPTADTLLLNGLNSYRSGNYQDAARELVAAAQSFLSPEQMEKYVSSGKFENLAGFETALIYLTLSQSKLANEDAARESILRLITAERIAPTYASLPLDPDAAEFEPLARRLVQDSALPANVQLAQLTTTPAAPQPATQTPPVQVAAAPSAATPPMTTTEVAAPEASIVEQAVATVLAPAPAPVADAAPPPVLTQSAPLPQPEPAQAAVTTAQAPALTQSAPLSQPEPEPAQALVTTPQPPAPTAVQTAEAERLDRERYIEERLAEERAKIQRAADERIASERVTIQRDADARVASAQRAAEERIAAERATIQPVSVAAGTVDTLTRRAYLTRLREAEEFVGNNDFRRAAGLYESLARADAVPRDILAESATGLYRTGAFSEAATAFRRLGTFGRGEEDLRYYHAVVLYETGQFDAAKHELSCALPFIQVTDEVARYKTKIQQTPTRQVTSPDRSLPAT